MVREDSIVPWKKRSPSPVEEESEHSSNEDEDGKVALLGDLTADHSSREGSFERNKKPVTLVTARTIESSLTTTAPEEAVSRAKVDLLNRYKKTHNNQS